MRMPRQRERLLYLLMLLVGVFYLLTIRSGHEWGDFAMYVHHAKNIVEGEAYDDTGYIYNPDAASYSPRIYPPVFPLLLTVPYRLYGLNLTPMKVEIIVLFTLFLLFLHLNIRSELPAPYTALLIAVHAFNVRTWGMKDYVLSDIPFLCSCYLALLLMKRVVSPPGSTTCRAAATRLLLGLVLYVCAGTRTIGMVLVPVLLVYEFASSRRVTTRTLIPLAVLFVMLAMQSLWLPSDGSYFDQLKVSAASILGNGLRYAGSMHNWFDGSGCLLVDRMVSAVFFVLAAAGLFLRLSRGIGIFEVFFVCYLSAVVLWPTFVGTRLLIPIIPLYLFYAFFCLAKVPKRALRVCALTAIIGALSTSYAVQYAGVSRLSGEDGGVEKATAVELFRWVREHTQTNAVFLFDKPRELALYTERNASRYACSDDGAMWEYVQTIGAGYIIKAPRMDSACWATFVDRSGARLVLEFGNLDFEVYRIVPL